MEKRIRQQGEISGSGNLSYMHKVEKMTFHQKTFKRPKSPKTFPIPKVTFIVTFHKKLLNHTK
jgi:hypothetical protein